MPNRRGGEGATPELGVRIVYAHMLLSQVEDDHVSLREFGERVAAEEKRLRPELQSPPYSPSTVSRWQQGAEPSLLTIVAICNVVNRAMRSARRTDRLDPGWLAFGDLSRAPSPAPGHFTLADLVSIRSRRGRRRG